MIFLGHLRDAWEALRLNSLRTALTMLGIIIGVAAVIAVMAVGAGAQIEVMKEIHSLGANLLLVSPGSATARAVRLGSGTSATLTEADAEAMRREIPHVTTVAPFVFTRGQVVHGNRNWSTRIQGVTLDLLRAREWELANGRPFTAEELEGAAKVALLGATVVDELFPEENPIGRVVRLANSPFTIIGTLARKGETSSASDQDDRIMVPLRTAQVRILGLQRTRFEAVDYILIKVADAQWMREVQTEVAALLRQRHALRPDAPDDFRVSDLVELQLRSEKASGVLGFWLTIVASVSLLVGGISIMNIMLVSVSERTREIGLRLAVGARPQDIRDQFLVEAIVLCLVGALAGMALGAVAALLIGALGTVPVLIEPRAVLLAAGFALAVGVFFGFYPAWRASKKDPIEALRFE